MIRFPDVFAGSTQCDQNLAVCNICEYDTIHKVIIKHVELMD
ncbi:hypothetical protein Mzhil_1924 [Methanosalsum zhilinae DSM 4017]|uniref:Uncharacterized protein n=1 Tax=Methanosalsum zhilinae (strain DSM 4017 / NBRC 107636 / OCM 62 / WeN5) TaxID=679901 RepID=F7XKI5_METZD|nr:hypothetical protein Mzhil_1924 [Methanosalsum zhilinae DSM 4017]